jgi:hypothetical protein
MSLCGLSQLCTFEFADIITDLNRVGCLELENGEIWLREWIRRPLVD